MPKNTNHLYLPNGKIPAIFMYTNEIYKKSRWMKILMLFSVLIFQILCFSSCEKKESAKKTSELKKNDPVATEILALEKMRLDATTRFDTVKLKQLLAPDFEITTAQGELLNIQQLLQKLNKRSQTQIQEKHYTKYTKVKFLSSNNVVLAKGMYVIERRETRGVITLTLRYTDLYVKSPESSWLLESSHVSRISR